MSLDWAKPHKLRHCQSHILLQLHPRARVWNIIFYGTSPTACRASSSLAPPTVASILAPPPAAPPSLAAPPIASGASSSSSQRDYHSIETRTPFQTTYICFLNPRRWSLRLKPIPKIAFKFLPLSPPRSAGMMVAKLPTSRKLLYHALVALQAICEQGAQELKFPWL